MVHFAVVHRGICAGAVIHGSVIHMRRESADVAVVHCRLGMAGWLAVVRRAVARRTLIRSRVGHGVVRYGTVIHVALTDADLNVSRRIVLRVPRPMPGVVLVCGCRRRMLFMIRGRFRIVVGPIVDLRRWHEIHAANQTVSGLRLRDLRMHGTGVRGPAVLDMVRRFRSIMGCRAGVVMSMLGRFHGRLTIDEVHAADGA